MIKRLLLDRIDTEARGAPITDEFDLAVYTLAHVTESALALMEPAVSRAEVTLRTPVFEHMPVLRRDNRVLHYLINSDAALRYQVL